MEVTERKGEGIQSLRTGDVDAPLSEMEKYKSTTYSDHDHPGSEEPDSSPVLPESHCYLSQMGEWPQRLLHAPSMTSFAWRPGNIYGVHKEPKYRAISYTWGRWKLHDGDEVEVQPAIQVGGVAWPIPRIVPSHFTDLQLKGLIERACSVDKKGLEPVDFVWLDLACIDQRRGLASDLEVGRQAGIFRNASGVVVWLSHSGKDKDSFGEMRGLFKMLHGFASDQKHTLEVMSDYSQLAVFVPSLARLLLDPWFTSLWTLQEAYLSRTAIILSADGEEFYDLEDGLFTLHTLARGCRLLSMVCTRQSHRQSEDPGLRHIANEIEGHTMRSGLYAIGKDDALLALLSSARFRETSSDEDRVYGIMQVFGYRLGKSDPWTYPADFYSRSELADQLGAALLKDRPLQSQLHAFCEPVEHGKGWHLSSSSGSVGQKYPLVPLTSNIRRRSAINWPDCECELSTREVRGTIYGHFEGRACSLSTLNSIWRKLDALPMETKFFHPNICRFQPDVSEHLMDSAEYHPGAPFDIPDERGRHIRFAQYLAGRFEMNNVIVLFLGALAKYQQYYGMLLLHVKVRNIAYWCRLGTCVWVYDDTICDMDNDTPCSPHWRDTMKGCGPEWIRINGLFG